MRNTALTILLFACQPASDVSADGGGDASNTVDVSNDNGGVDSSASDGGVDASSDVGLDAIVDATVEAGSSVTCSYTLTSSCSCGLPAGFNDTESNVPVSIVAGAGTGCGYPFSGYDMKIEIGGAVATDWARGQPSFQLQSGLDGGFSPYPLLCSDSNLVWQGPHTSWSANISVVGTTVDITSFTVTLQDFTGSPCSAQYGCLSETLSCNGTATVVPY